MLDTFPLVPVANVQFNVFSFFFGCMIGLFVYYILHSLTFVLFLSRFCSAIPLLYF